MSLLYACSHRKRASMTSLLGMNGGEDWGGFRDTQIEINWYNSSLSVSRSVFKWGLFTVSHNVPLSLFCLLCLVILCVNVASQFQGLFKSFARAVESALFVFPAEKAA